MHQKTMYPKIVRAIACLALPLMASAATMHRKPGLWEITTQMNFTKGGPQIPAEQLEKMKQMGIQLPFNRPMRIKQCLTAEEAARDDHPDFGKERDCQLKNAKFSGNSFSGDMVCDGPEMKGSGTMTASFPNDQSYRGTWHFAGTSPRSGEMEMNNDFSGKWLGSDCGDVKPFSHPSAPPAH
jgi:hypothetical protein